MLPEVNMITRVSAAVTVLAIGSTIRSARAPALEELTWSSAQTRCNAGSSVLGTDSTASKYRWPRNSGTLIRNCTAAERSCDANSRGRNKVLNGTSTAPMRVSAIAICTQRTPLGMIRPTRVPLPTPAWMNAAAKSDVDESSSR